MEEEKEELEGEEFVPGKEKVGGDDFEDDGSPVDDTDESLDALADEEEDEEESFDDVEPEDKW